MNGLVLQLAVGSGPFTIGNVLGGEDPRVLALAAWMHRIVADEPLEHSGSPREPLFVYGIPDRPTQKLSGFALHPLPADGMHVMWDAFGTLEKYARHVIVMRAWLLFWAQRQTEAKPDETPSQAIQRAYPLALEQQEHGANLLGHKLFADRFHGDTRAQASTWLLLPSPYAEALHAPSSNDTFVGDLGLGFRISPD